MGLTTPPIVSAEWVRSHRVVLADVRWHADGRPGEPGYVSGHLPGAVFVDLDHALAAPATPSAGRHPLPDPEHFASAMSACGIGDDSVVVGYDDEGGVFAARLVWMLRAIGHEAALLDGGLLAWDGEISHERAVPSPAGFTARPWPAELLAEVDDVVRPGAVVLDARSGDRYRGEVEPIDPLPGHIPGAVNLPCRDNLDPAGRFLPVDDLRERFASVGVTGSQDVIAYCGSGVTACHDLLAMEHAGLGQGRLYPGSWSQYCSTGLPVATG